MVAGNNYYNGDIKACILKVQILPVVVCSKVPLFVCVRVRVRVCAGLSPQLTV